MFSKLLAFILFAAAISNVAGTCAFITIDGGLPSTLCIVTRLCHNPSKAQEFNACYDQVAIGKQQFTGCQKQAFDQRLLDTQANVQWACFPWNLPRLATYASCLGPAFTAAGVDQSAAVLAVNKCQGKALGLKV